jgi:hypothetical protein
MSAIRRSRLRWRLRRKRRRRLVAARYLARPYEDLLDQRHNPEIIRREHRRSYDASLSAWSGLPDLGAGFLASTTRSGRVAAGLDNVLEDPREIALACTRPSWPTAAARP